MSLVDALLLEGYRDPREVYIALCTDGLKGSGTIDDPFDGSRRNFPTINVSSLTSTSAIATAVTSSSHGFKTGDMVTIGGVGTSMAGDRLYTGTFSVTVISDTAFTYVMLGVPSSSPATGSVVCNRERELFDTVMRALPANCLIHIGPGVFESKGRASGIDGWGAKTGQHIVGSGMAITTLKLVGSSWPELQYVLISPNRYDAFLHWCPD